ncbi:protease modulator HflC [Rhodovulum sp. DZ06]|uniref:protease modulator HflC n=1 Tax=Rhodovulum sp. DZ06 TaxID=3425126 RepID=UPI003D333C1A
MSQVKKAPIILGAVGVALFAIYNSVFIVDERQQALKLRFGQVVGQTEGYRDPGLYFKVPVIDRIAYYEDRILPIETSSLEVTPLDDRRLVVDAFARWRITDPLRFRQSVSNEQAALPRLERVLNAAIREVLGGVVSDAILSSDRIELMNQIRASARRSAQTLGVEIIDVRMRRADLPTQNLQATFQRMQAEREREAADERARGQEAAQKVQANADRQAVELVSEARKQSEVIRGEADAQRNRVFAEAFGRDPEFFAFYRSLRAYEQSLKGSNSTLVISPNSEFFEYLDGAAASPQ